MKIFRNTRVSGQVQCDEVLSSCCSAPPTLLSLMMMALQDFGDSQLNTQSPHSSNPSEVQHNSHLPKTPHVQQTCTLSPAHSSCIPGCFVELPLVGVVDCSNRPLSFITSLYVWLSAGLGVLRDMGCLQIHQQTCHQECSKEKFWKSTLSLSVSSTGSQSVILNQRHLWILVPLLQLHHIVFLSVLHSVMWLQPFKVYPDPSICKSKQFQI